MRTIRLVAVTTAAAALVVTGAIPTVAATGEHADSVENLPTIASGGPDLLVIENTMLERSADGLTITVTIPTPEPRSYTYPEGVPLERQAYPEAFTGWVGIFNHPELCTTSETPPFCGAGDRNDEVKWGMYHFAGHASSLTLVDGEARPDVSSDGMLVLHGSVDVGDQFRDMPGNRPDIPKYALENPEGAEVHVLIAPHGQFDYSNETELMDPTGNSKCDCRWISKFSPDALVAKRAGQ